MNEMTFDLHPIDLGIIIAYGLLMVGLGLVGVLWQAVTRPSA